jgi:hypothetical protein
VGAAYVSIRQHTSAYASIRQHTLREEGACGACGWVQHTSAYVSIPCGRRVRVEPAGVLGNPICMVVLGSSEAAARLASIYVSIRQYTSAYVSIRWGALRRQPGWRRRQSCQCLYFCTSKQVLLYQYASTCVPGVVTSVSQHPSAYVSIRQHTTASVRIRQHSSASVSIRQHTSAYVSICQHSSAYVNIRPDTSTYVRIREHTHTLLYLASTSVRAFLC